MARLSGKSVMITAAASGIGAAFARRTAAEGARLLLTDINMDGLQGVAEEIRGSGGEAIEVLADATQDAAMANAVAKAVDAYGRLDVTFANAGIPCMASIDEITYELFQKVMTVNVYSTILTARVSADVMKTQDSGGKIINTCSVSGKTALAGDNLYCASKFAVRSLTSGMAKEFAPFVTVNALCPGVIDTPLWDGPGAILESRGVVEKASDTVGMFGKLTLAGRAAQPEELTGLAVFLASNEADYLNGQCINIDGGYVYD